MAINDLVVAIELGSSKIAGAVGRKCADGSLQVLAYADEPVAGAVRRGVAYNIDQTAQALSNLINRIEPELGNYTIEQVYVGVGGYTLHSEHNIVVRTFEEETRVAESMVDEMEEENAYKQYPGYGMLMMVSQEYKIGNNLLNDPVGVNCTQVEGNYLNILTRTSVMQNTAKSFEMAKINIADTAISPLAAANVLLTDSERRQGCVLLDFGADTTTVSVYKGGYLRFLTVIPMGGQSITRDLGTLNLVDDEAERLKCEYGLVAPASSDETLTLDEGRTVGLRKVYEVIGLLMDGTENCCQSGVQMEIAPQDEGRAVTGDLFTEDGESMQAKRDEELRQLREQKIKEAEERKMAMQNDKQKSTGNGFLTGLVKRMRSMGDNIDKLANDFLKDEEKE